MLVFIAPGKQEIITATGRVAYEKDKENHRFRTNLDQNNMKYKKHKHEYRVTVRFSFKERLKQIILLIMIGEIRYWLEKEELEEERLFLLQSYGRSRLTPMDTKQQQTMKKEIEEDFKRKDWSSQDWRNSQEGIDRLIWYISSLSPHNLWKAREALRDFKSGKI